MQQASGSLPILHCALVAVLACCGAAARADDGATGPSWTFGGFGTLGMAHSDEGRADYTSSVLKANGAGRTRSWSPHLDTRLGAQLSVTADKQWSGVVQLVSEQGLGGNYKPIVEWANIKYQATPNLSLRFGRIALPIFLAADYRKVGYAYPWVRTPLEVYGAIPISNSDGVDASYRWNNQGVKHVEQLFLGHTDMKLYETSRLNVRKMAGLSHSTEFGAFSARVSYMTADLTLDLARPVFDGFRQFGPQGAAIAEQFDVDHKRVDALSIGASYDPGNWFLMGEIGRMNARSYLGKTRSVYASAGYRAGDFTPYLTFSSIQSRSPANHPGLTLDGLPPPLAYAGAELNNYLGWLLTTVPVQRTLSAGLRWDVMPSVALKIQLDRVQARRGSMGFFQNVEPGYVPGRAVRVTSVTLDFVF
jgi:hypothetical protein